MTRLNVGGLELPLETATEAIAILGKRGSGKTNTAVVLAEELHHAGIPFVVVDTVGVWWGLGSSADGKKEGLNAVVVFGGQHGHVPLEEKSGEIIANAVVDYELSCVIDTSLLSKAAARRFLLDFVTKLYHRKTTQRTPLHVIFDEADELAPQRPTPEGARLLGAMEDFVRRGRSRGLGCTLVTQRPAVLNKDVLTQVEVLIAMRMTGPNDIKAIDEWTKQHADESEGAQVKQTLASLPTGEGWVWSPQWLEILQRIQFRARTTFDSSATPKIGQQRVEPVKRAPIDIALLGEMIADTVEKAKADDPRELRSRIGELERQLQAALATTPEPEVKVIEVPVLAKEDREFLAQQGNLLHQGVLDLLRTVNGDLGSLVTSIWEAGDKLLGAVELDVSPRGTLAIPAALPQAREPATMVAGKPNAPRVVVAGDTGLSSMQRAILTVLLQRGPSTRRRIGAFAGKSHGGGAFTTAMGQLSGLGYIEQTNGAAAITEAGAAALGDVEPLPTGQDLIDSLLGRMTSMERAIFETLIAAHPAGLTRAEIGERSGKSASGGAFTTAIGKLKRVELVRAEGPLNYVSEEVAEAMR